MSNSVRPAEEINTNWEGARPHDDTRQDAEEALDRLARFVEARTPSTSPRSLPAPTMRRDETPRLPAPETVERRKPEPVAEATPTRRGPPILTVVVLFLTAVAAVGAVFTLGGGANWVTGPPAIGPARHRAPPPAAPPPTDGAAPAPAMGEDSVAGLGDASAFGPPRGDLSAGSVAPADEPPRGAGELATPTEAAPTAPSPASQASGPAPVPREATKDAATADQAIIQFAVPEFPTSPEPKAGEQADLSAEPVSTARQPDEPSVDPGLLRSRAAALADAPLPPIRPAWLRRADPRERARRMPPAAEASEPPAPERGSETQRNPPVPLSGAAQ